MNKVKLLLLLITFMFFSGCAVVPITGRKQLSLVPYSQLIALSNASYEQVLKDSKLSDDYLSLQMIREVGYKIVDAAEDFMSGNPMGKEMKEYKWEFQLIEDDEIVNAFCLPGGKVVVYSGILEVTQDQAGLATVLSHEIAHDIANHGGERISQMLLVELGEVTLSEALSKNPNQTSQVWMMAYGIGANLGIILPYSRTHELEADRIGLILMAKAGYNPEAAISFWERMQKQEKTRPLEFLSTHPAPDRRIQDIRNALPEAMKYYKN